MESAASGKLPKEDRKGLVIGMKDQKKFRNYKDIETFVTYYPAGAKRYEKLMTTINRDLGKFVDFMLTTTCCARYMKLTIRFSFSHCRTLPVCPKNGRNINQRRR